MNFICDHFRPLSVSDLLTAGVYPSRIMAMSTFGERLRKWRVEKRVTTYRLEKDLGIDRSNLRQIEKGLKPASDGFLDKLANYPRMGIRKETLLAWQRLDSASMEELVEMFRTLADDETLVRLISQVLQEKRDRQS